MIIGKRIRMVACSLVLAGATGCAAESMTVPPLDGLGEVIIYETSPGPMCGRCDTTKLTLAADGRIWVEHGYWAGEYRNWRTRVRVVQSTPEAFAQFRARLSPYRPVGRLWLRDADGCGTFLYDGSEVRLQWQGGPGRSELWFTDSCDPAVHAPMFEAVSLAIDSLGLGDLPGVHPVAGPAGILHIRQPGD